MFTYLEKNMIDPNEDLNMQRMTGDSDCKHTHDFLELVYTQAGSMLQMVDDKLYQTAAGMLLVCLPGQSHSYFMSDDRQTKYINILIRIPPQNSHGAMEEAVGEFLRVFARGGQVPLLRLDEDVEKAYAFSLEEMLRLYEQKPPGYKAALREQLTRLLTAGIEQRRAPAAGQDDRRLSIKVLESIEKELPLIKTPGELAEALCYDAGYLTKNFKKTFGMTITDYMQRTRIDMARYLLWATDLSIEEISKTVGYHNRTYFYKIFREKIGSSPAEIRTRYRKMASRFLDQS